MKLSKIKIEQFGLPLPRKLLIFIATVTTSTHAVPLFKIIYSIDFSSISFKQTEKKNQKPLALQQRQMYWIHILCDANLSF